MANAHFSQRATCTVAYATAIVKPRSIYFSAQDYDSGCSHPERNAPLIDTCRHAGIDNLVGHRESEMAIVQLTFARASRVRDGIVLQIRERSIESRRMSSWKKPPLPEQFAPSRAKDLLRQLDPVSSSDNKSREICPLLLFIRSSMPFIDASLTGERDASHRVCPFAH